MTTTASMILRGVCNSRKNSDIRADDRHFLGQVDAELNALREEVEAAKGERDTLRLQLYAHARDGSRGLLEQQNQSLKTFLAKASGSLEGSDILLCNIGQLIEGWYATTPQQEWSSWDEKVREERSILHRNVLAAVEALASAEKLLDGDAPGKVCNSPATGAAQ